ncbi:ATPase, partial [Rodentibacter ratti]
MEKDMKLQLPIKQRITKLLKQISAEMQERDQILAITLLAAIAGQNTFLYGPPGTAKSLISRRLACAFELSSYFECLMNRFTTPEEIFGPVSIKALKEDRYLRQIDGYLPTADFAFLDEIWKSSPAILNNLLTIINEHLFKNGNERISVPLKSLISASNEIPAENQGLDALYDRFIVRLLVPPIKENDNFQRLLNSRQSAEKPIIDSKLVIGSEELIEWREQLHNIQLSNDTMLIIKYIRQELVEKFDELNVYVSDRRWQRAAILLKASAFCNGRNETNHSDVALLKYCLWTTPENRDAVENIVMTAIKDCGFDSGIDLAELDREKEKLDQEIHKELYHSEDIYETHTINGKEYF